MWSNHQGATLARISAEPHNTPQCSQQHWQPCKTPLMHASHSISEKKLIWIYMRLISITLAMWCCNGVLWHCQGGKMCRKPAASDVHKHLLEMHFYHIYHIYLRAKWQSMITRETDKPVKKKILIKKDKSIHLDCSHMDKAFAIW